MHLLSLTTKVVHKLLGIVADVVVVLGDTPALNPQGCPHKVWTGVGAGKGVALGWNLFPSPSPLHLPYKKKKKKKENKQRLFRECTPSSVPVNFHIPD